ncbi:exported hypothetical protein [Bradyrhizobium sp. STM 3843]|uniref:caspase family protein n=1 Tax=Bradyrhizobium sp. STM 3843 TaxID=551947 RepID=UPI000240AF13|nr:caspase family protein [Bradyrhizobium sp. STM 3843]CCE05694.1 exported hypothetical protein [Bradyrhizobium sp. STM 3843]
MKVRIFRTLFALLLLVPLAAGASAAERRLALVIGNAAYKAGPLATPANDAALVAETLRSVGFEVTGSRDLEADPLRRAFGDFREKVRGAGPGTVVLVYFSGLALQLEGDNYLIPVDAAPGQASDIRRDALQLSGLLRSLVEAGPKAAFIILDAARRSPFSISDGPPAGGFAWIEPEANSLVALNAAPGTIAPDDKAGFGAYAIALTEMIRQGGLEPEDLFARVRLRVTEATNGSQVPWHVSRLQDSFVFAERPSDAQLRTDRPELTRSFRTRPMRALSPGDAYLTALMRDTFDGYSEFLAEYWKDPMTRRVRALLSARREILTWRCSIRENTPNAYWMYLERYPHGPHGPDARRILARAGAGPTAPSKFATTGCDIPAPLPDEVEYVERAPLSFGDPAFAFEPLGPLPDYFLSASASELRRLSAPAAPIGSHDLPVVAPASISSLTLPAVATPLRSKKVEQPRTPQSTATDVGYLTSAVPLASQPVPLDSSGRTAASIGNAVGELADPTAAPGPWTGGGLRYQSLTPSADTLGAAAPQGLQQTTSQSAPSLLNGGPAWNRPAGQTLGASVNEQTLAPAAPNQMRSPGINPLPNPRASKRGVAAVRPTTRNADGGASAAGAVGDVAPSAGAKPPSTQPLASRAGVKPMNRTGPLPARTGVSPSVNSGAVAADGVSTGRPVTRMSKTKGAPAKKLTPEAPSETEPAPEKPDSLPPSD